jgi:glycopeptide antibiotics resistance protein
MNPPTADHGYGRPSWRPRVFLRQAQDKLTLRRTVQVRLGFDLGFGISDLGSLITIDDIELNSSDFAICSPVLRSFSANFQSAIRIPRSSIRWHVHLRGLATAIHAISGLGL